MLVQIFGRNETIFSPHKALKMIAWGKLAFDERVVLHRVATYDSTGTLVFRRMLPYRGTSLIRKSALLGPYSRTMPRAL